MRSTLRRIVETTDTAFCELVDRKLPSLRDAHLVPGLEVEKLPAVIVNGEQVTAGNIMTYRDLREYIVAVAKTA